MTITDASTELANLGWMIRKADRAKGQNVLNGFASCLGVKATEAVYFELLAAVRSRIEGLALFATTVDDPEFTDLLRESVLQATGSFAKLFDPAQLVLVWDSTRASHLPDAHLTTLTWFGQTVRRHKPLRLVEASHRDELLVQIGVLLVDIEGDTSLGWKQALLAQGLRRLQLIVKHLECFGHETAIHELFNFHQRVAAISEVEEAVPEGRSDSFSIWKTLTLINLAASLFIMPDQAMTAVSRYERLVREVISSSTSQPAKPRLLPSPKSIPPAVQDDELRAP